LQQRFARQIFDREAIDAMDWCLWQSARSRLVYLVAATTRTGFGTTLGTGMSTFVARLYYQEHGWRHESSRIALRLFESRQHGGQTSSFGTRWCSVAQSFTARTPTIGLWFVLAWDRSIHVLLFKDVSNAHLAALLPKVVPGMLHTLKITYDPTSDQRRLPNGTVLASTLPWKELLTHSKKPSFLQRLYLGHVRFSKANTKPLLEACQQSTSLTKLELCLCQFESGTGHLWQELVTTLRNRHCEKQSLRQIDFLYPIITKRTTTTT
jgi:hypothetical protein